MSKKNSPARNRLSDSWWSITDGGTTEVYAPDGRWWKVDGLKDTPIVLSGDTGEPVKRKCAERILAFLAGGPNPQ